MPIFRDRMADILVFLRMSTPLDQVAAAINANSPELKLTVRGHLPTAPETATQVWLVDFVDEQERRLGILKLIRNAKAEREGEGDERARTSWLKTFLPDRFMRLDHVGDVTPIIMSLAKDRLSNCVTLRTAIADSFSWGADHVLRAVAVAYGNEIASRWQGAGMVSLHSVIHEAFKGRINSTWVTEWVEAGFPTASCPGLVLDGFPMRLPNPVHVFRHPGSLPDALSVRAPIIQSHGDLHAENILCPSVDRAQALGLIRNQPHPPKVWPHMTLIDTPFADSAVYTFDLAFLAASLRFLLPSLSTNRERDAFLAGISASLATITTRGTKSAIPPEADRYARCLSTLWAQCVRTQPKMEDDIARTFLASLAGAALWQAAKTVSHDRHEALRALLVSAYAIRELFEVNQLNAFSGPDFELRSPASRHIGSLGWTEAASAITKVIDEAEQRGGAILVLGDQWRTYLDRLLAREREFDGPSAIRAIGALPLRVIVDWSTDDVLRVAVSAGMPQSRYLVTCVPGLPTTDAGSTRALPYVHLRGVSSNLATLATTPPERNRNRAILHRLFETLRSRFGTDLAVVYVGVTREILNELHTFLHGFFVDARDVKVTAITEDLASLQTFAEDWNMELLGASLDDFVAAARDRASAVLAPAGDSARNRSLLIADIGRDKDGELTPQPGALLTVDVQEADHLAFARAGQVIYSDDPAAWSRLDRDPRAFLVGHRITFAEIANDVLFDRNEFAAYENAVRDSLAQRQTHYIAVPARPGAGSSTTLKWLAYRFAVDSHVPTLVLERGGNVAFEAIERLYGLVSRAMLVVADPQDVPADEVAGLRTRCALMQYPATILTSVRIHRSGDLPLPVLPIELAELEKVQLIDRLAKYCPAVDIALLRVSQTRSLFLLLLEAFGGANVRVNDFVANLLEEASEDQRQLIATIALTSHYAHRPCTTEFLSLASDYAPRDVNGLLEEFDQLLILKDGAGEAANSTVWSCRHDLLSRAIVQYFLTRGFDDDEFRYRLAEFAVQVITRVGSKPVGRDVTAEFVWALLNPQLESVRSYGEERPTQSRLIGGEDGLPNNAARRLVFGAAATTFPDHVNIISHYGKFLSEEERKYTEADRYLQRAYELEPKNEALSHMLGTRCFDELRERLTANSHPRSSEVAGGIATLYEAAQEWFLRARRLNIGSEYSYVTAIHLDFTMIRDEFRRLGVAPSLAAEALRSDHLAEERVMMFIGHADSLLNEAFRYIAPDTRVYLDNSRSELYRLRGDLTSAIQACQRVIRERSGAVRTHTRMMLARYLVERGDGNWRKGDVGKANRDYTEAERLLQEVLQDPRRRADAVRLWFDSARHLSHWHRDDFLSRLHQIEERDDGSLDTLFLLMCLYFSDAVQTNSTASWRRYEEYQAKTAAIAAPLAVRRYIREWLVGVAVRDEVEYRIFPAQLFASANDPSVDVKPIRDNRVRLRGRVVRVESSTVGFIAIEPAGFEVYFQPRIKEREFYRSDAAAQVPVDFMVAFTYEKPRAYDVERVSGRSV